MKLKSDLDKYEQGWNKPIVTKTVNILLEKLDLISSGNGQAEGGAHQDGSRAGGGRVEGSTEGGGAGEGGKGQGEQNPKAAGGGEQEILHCHAGICPILRKQQHNVIKRRFVIVDFLILHLSVKFTA